MAIEHLEWTHLLCPREAGEVPASYAGEGGHALGSTPSAPSGHLPRDYAGEENECYARTSSMALPSRSTISPIWSAVTMNGGASRT
jgi:hypothetical protein